MTIEQAKTHVGSGVVRRTHINEDGVITSVNDSYVFVRYKGDNFSKATSPNELELLARPKL